MSGGQRQGTGHLDVAQDRRFPKLTGLSAIQTRR
jgi:hypothetical protein